MIRIARAPFPVSFAVALALVAAGIQARPAAALERTTARLARESDWSSNGTTAVLRYHNTCNGWIWLWSGWDPGRKVGAVYDVSDPDLEESVTLIASQAYTASGWPSGYGYTGTISVNGVDAADCPVDPPVASQPWLPPFPAGWSETVWNAQIPPAFAIVLTNGGATGNPLLLGSDHPAAAGGDPPACGTCYPTTRGVHSYDWGTASSPLCPGSPLNDGACDAELLLEASVFVVYIQEPPVGIDESLEASSWGRLKTLYR